MKKRFVLGLACLSLIAVGCNAGVSEEDTAAMKKEFSQANYEKAMKAAGKGDQLEAEKAAAAERGD